MEHHPRPRSRPRLVGANIAGVVVGLLVLTMLWLGVLVERDYRTQKTAELSAVAGILASTVSAALSFHDGPAAEEYLGHLVSNPEILAAAVYDETGAVFARYTRVAESPAPERASDPASSSTERQEVVVAVPVLAAGSKVGSVYLRGRLAPASERLPQYALAVLLVLVAGVLVAMLGAAQSALARANDELSARAEDLSRANESLQAEMAGREKAEQALRQIQKMETIGQLTGGVAHDFNNLLTIILGNIERLLRRADAGASVDEIKKIAGYAKIGADRAATLTKSLLAFARRQPLDPKPIDLNRLISDISDLLRRTLGERI